MEKAETIWMNGEFVAWDDAKVHVLSHGLHYGTGVFEGIRAYETERGTAVFRHRDHLDRLLKSAELYYLPMPLRRRGAARGDERADPPQRPRLLLHPPARVPRLRRDGPVREERADRGDDRDLAVGRLPRRGGQAARDPREGLLLAADLPRRADPAREGIGPVPELDPRQDRERQRRLRRGDPARRPRHGLRGLGREHLRRPRGPDPDPAAHGLDPRRDQPPLGDPDRPRPRLHGRRARHRPLRALPGRGDLPDRHRRRAGAGSRDRRPRDRRARARSRGSIQAKFEDALHGRAPEYAEWLDPVDQPSKVAS